MSYIYKITNKINGKIYIGKTNRTVEERWESHKRDSVKETLEKRPLYSAMRKYGIKNFLVETIEECSLEDSSNREKYWIEFYGSFKYGYNATIGGDGKPYIDREKVINIYNQLRSAKDTAKELNICSDSVLRILRENNIVPLTSYEVQKEKFGKPVNMFDLKENFIKNFSSLWEAANYMVDNNLTGCKVSTIKQHISEVCRGKRKTAAGYKWKFISNNID
ncbi:GIY-YIG nuclease family protein [bacterium]|nr:GIY-YIG nuclease family protein [bacterium]